MWAILRRGKHICKQLHPLLLSNCAGAEKMLLSLRKMGMSGAHSGIVGRLVAVADDLLQPLDVRQRCLAGAVGAQVLRLEVAWQHTEVV